MLNTRFGANPNSDCFLRGQKSIDSILTDYPEN